MRYEKGFLFIEAMLATVILAIGIVAVMRAFNTTILAVRSAREYSEAIFLLDDVFFRMQTEKDPRIDDEGSFKGNLSGYNWKIITDAKEREDNLPLANVNMSVWWKTKKAKRAHSAATLLPLRTEGN